MTHTKKQLRLGRTAIAAVLAFSSTPLLAQPAGSPPVVTVPTPAPPVVTQPAPAAPATLRVQPIPAMDPVVNTPEPGAEARAAPARRATAAQATTRTRTVSRVVAPAASAPPASSESAIEAAPVAPLAEAPVVEPAVPMTAEPAIAPVESTATEAGSDLLPIVGGAAALLALAGGAYALSRRRRYEDDEAVEAETWESDHVAPAEAAPVAAAWAAPEPAPQSEYREPEIVPVPTPAMARESAVDPALSPIAGSDLSRYGRHVQAAYAGPTPDNPSLSLKRRLKRAAFFDQRERMASEAVATPEPMAAAAPVQAAEVAAPRRDAMVTSRRVKPKASTQALFGFRPAFQN